MRQARIKPSEMDTFMHLYNRVVGHVGEFPFNAFYEGKRSVRAGTRQAAALPEHLRDVSRFMKDLQQQFTRWFNRTRPILRRGHLWQERFKSTILESGLSVWHCWKYMELNPVRARIVANPADYRFCTCLPDHARNRHRPTVRSAF